MKTINIILSDNGSNLGSRLQAKHIMSKMYADILVSTNIVVDFSGVKQITLSFGTEIFDTLFSMDKNFETKNENDFVKGVVNFCKSNLKQKEIHSY